MIEIIKKSLKAVIGGILYGFCLKTFPLVQLSEKRIVIVGPAESALSTGLGKIIDDFDVVIRLNKAPYQLIQKLHVNDIGQKTDILFHSFLENPRTGGGKLDFKLFDKLGIKYVVNPIPTNFGRRLILNFYKKYLIGRRTYLVEYRPFKAIEKSFRRYRPTTGFAALNFLLHTDFQHLHITGFTFFRTTYSKGYRDHFTSKEKNDEHLKNEDAHNPEIELKQFIETLQNRSEMYSKITTDHELSKIVAQESSIQLNVLSLDSNKTNA